MFLLSPIFLLSFVSFEEKFPGSLEKEEARRKLHHVFLHYIFYNFTIFLCLLK
jgi:hypothetical protein